MTDLSSKLTDAFGSVLYPRRLTRPADAAVSESEVEAWVETAGNDYFVRLDEAFVTRALGLGVSSGMVLDLGSRLALIPMKILWQEEGLLSIGVYRSPAMAERGRQTAAEWNLQERMFFQVGEPGRMKFKTHYFDMVVSDGMLHQSADPARMLGEINRVTKPSGAILVREMARPSRFRLSRHLSKHGGPYGDVLRNWFENAVRAGFTPRELSRLVQQAGLTRTQVVRDGIHVLVERRGTDDPSSWVVERERYN